MLLGIIRAGREILRDTAAVTGGVWRDYPKYVMSVKVTYRDGIFAPLEKVEGAKQGTIYTVFSDEELLDIRETVGWLKAAEESFDFWNNPADAVYDTL